MGAQMSCLDGRLNRLAELTRLLATGDPQVIETATEGVAMLAPLEPCTDPALAGASLLPPIALRDQVMEVDAELARAEALRRAGKLAEAAQVADDALGTALEIEHPPLHAHALLTLGQVRSTMKENRAAEENLRKALLIAESAGDTETAVRALINLGLVVGYQQKRHGEGEQMLALARAKLARHDPGPRVKAMLERNVGLLLLDQRRFDDAFVPLDRARVLLADAYGEDSVQVTTALNALALLAANKGEFGAAIDYYERSSAILSEALGPRHPTVAGLMLNLGVIALQQGDWAKAERWQREGLSILRESVGDDHPFVAQALSNLAASLVGSGQIEEALQLQREALEIKRARLDPDDPSIAVSLNNLGAALNLAGRDEEALALHEEALELRTRTLGAQHLETNLSLTNIGLSQLALGRAANAEQTLQRAVAGIEANLGPRAPKLVEPLRGLGEAQLELGHREQARALLERAQALRADPTVDRIQAADVDFALARLLEREDPDAAREHAERAAEAYQSLGRDNPRAQRIEQWLHGHGRASG
jgi:serine/threonine-protein kinase